MDDRLSKTPTCKDYLQVRMEGGCRGCVAVVKEYLTTAAERKSASPKGFRKIAQGCRAAATLGTKGRSICTPTGFRNGNAGIHNPFRVDRMIVPVSQGSRCSATMGYPVQSLRDNNHSKAEQPTSDFDCAVQKLTDQREKAAKESSPPLLGEGHGVRAAAVDTHSKSTRRTKKSRKDRAEGKA